MLGKFFNKPYAEIGPGEAQAAAERGACLVDVREPHEWQSGHAPKARHIPLGDLPARAGELPKGREILLICRSGNRSGKAAALLARQRDDVSNVVGGMQAWAAEGLPVVAKGGGQGRIV